MSKIVGEQCTFYLSRSLICQLSARRTTSRQSSRLLHEVIRSALPLLERIEDIGREGSWNPQEIRARLTKRMDLTGRLFCTREGSEKCELDFFLMVGETEQAVFFQQRERAFEMSQGLESRRRMFLVLFLAELCNTFPSPRPSVLTWRNTWHRNDYFPHLSFLFSQLRHPVPLHHG